MPARKLSPMELVNSQKETNVDSGLRLVNELDTLRTAAEVEKQFVNFNFYRVSPDWRKLDASAKSIYKSEFQAVYERFREDFLLFSYSLVGFDSKADLMFWRIGSSMDRIQEMTAQLFRTSLGSYFESSDVFMAVTKDRQFVTDSVEDKNHVNAGEKKYHFVYPCSKSRDWQELSADERDALIEQNFMVGKRFENIKIHLTHAFGFNEQEYIISFETDEPRDFLALAEELRQTPASKFTLRGMPIYTCRQKPLMECLDALG
ncbi:MAG: chlorite dismutase family protein [Pyrinomonadaceae bacterium]